MTSTNSTNKLMRQARLFWRSPRTVQVRNTASKWRNLPYSGPVTLILGTLLATLFIMAIDRSVVALVNPGLIYLPLIGMLAYHWKWHLALVAAILQLFCVYFFFITPINSFKAPDGPAIAQLIVLAAAMVFVLAIVQLAVYGRGRAERAAGRFAALNRIGSALASELDETRLLHLIAETARDLTDAGFAAFTLRPVNEVGEPLVPSEGYLFHLAAAAGVTKEQEEWFRHVPLGGEGLLAPIFHHGKPVRVGDALAFIHHPDSAGGKFRPTTAYRNAAQQAALDYAHGHLAKEGLRSMGVPRGHPMVRSFLGAPLLDRAGNVRGGLLLGHIEPDKFSAEDEALLVGLATEAAIAVENARLYSAAQDHARELDTIFESIADGITLVDEEGKIVRENRTARHLREKLESAEEQTPGQQQAARMLWQKSAAGETEQGVQVAIVDDHKDVREYLVNTTPLHPPSAPLKEETPGDMSRDTLNGAVVVWHDVTEAHRLLSEQQAHAETEARRALLQTVLNELPGSVYLVRGRDARLVLANRATTEVWGARWEPDVPLGEFLAQNGIRVSRIDGRPLALEEFATLRAVETGVPVRHHQEIIRHADGTTLPVLVNAVALDARVLGNHESQGQDVEPAAIVVHLDVTALKEAERVKDEFIGIAAHELRTPLAVIKGFAQMLIMQTKRGKGPELADWQTEAIADIDSATSRLVELTEDLLDVTRLQAGRLELQLTPTDLVALVKRIVARFQVTAGNHHITVNSVQEHLVSNVDPHRIDQVFSNLINNAIKYSPDGGEISITLAEDEQNALFSIEDHGIGIPLQQHGRIFSRFMRADNTYMHDIKGTGLGLYLCRELVEHHGGRIWFKSVEGEGSTFYVSLPLYRKPSCSADPYP